MMPTVFRENQATGKRPNLRPNAKKKHLHSCAGVALAECSFLVIYYNVPIPEARQVFSNI